MRRSKPFKRRGGAERVRGGVIADTAAFVLKVAAVGFIVTSREPNRPYSDSAA